MTTVFGQLCVGYLRFDCVNWFSVWFYVIFWQINGIMRAVIIVTHQVTHQVQLHLVNDSSQGSSSPLSSVTGRAAIGLEDQLLVHEEVHLPSSPSLKVVFK